jgi:tRNA-modifying protein YgfZ
MHDSPTQENSAEAPVAAAIALEQYGFLAVEGARAIQFLQGQLTCNMSDASAQVALPGAYCSPKGRVLGNFLLWAESAERIVLRMRADILDETANVLNKYAALSRVRVGRTEPQLHCIGLLGDGLDALLAARLGGWPTRPRTLCPTSQGCIVRPEDSASRHEIWTPQQHLPSVMSLLGSVLPSGDQQAWLLDLVRCGSADVQAPTRDQFLPQVLGYDRHAVSFRKGCYTGQEIIARTHYKGQVKRHLQRFAAAQGAVPAIGSELQQGPGGRAVGTVVECATRATGGFELLAVTSDDALGEDREGICTTSGQMLDLLPIRPVS